MNKAVIILKPDEIKELAYIKNAIKNYISDFRLIFISDEENIKVSYENSYLLKTNSYYNENIVTAIMEIIKDFNPDFIFSTSSYEIKNTVSQIAVKTESGVLTDCYRIETEDRKLYAEKYAYGGNIIARLVSDSKIKIITFSGSMPFDNSKYETNSQEIKLKDSSYVQIISKEKTDMELTPDSAEKVIGIGRGVKIEDIPLIKKFARSINAAVGYTRPVIYEGVASHEYQIGITGKIIYPKIYIALGISGKEYHIKGIEKSQKIISVNIDPDAPIKDVSDYFICSDYKKFIEKITMNN